MNRQNWGDLWCRFFIFALLYSPAASTAQTPAKPSLKTEPQIFLMGEIHDNSHGHQLRHQHLMQLVDQGLKPVVAMEQFDRDKQTLLDLALKQCTDVDCVLAKAATPGWDWQFYRPIVQLALDKKVKLLAANLSTVDVQKVMVRGFSAVFSPQAINAYKLHQIPSALQSAQNKAIQEGHCNMLPDQAIGPMVQAQIGRDVWMASVINDLQDPVVVLIAGNGHVRKDAGIFQWLSKDRQLKTQVHGYVERSDSSDAHWFDQTHIVPTVEREDPCLTFASRSANK